MQRHCQHINPSQVTPPTSDRRSHLLSTYVSMNCISTVTSGIAAATLTHIYLTRDTQGKRGNEHGGQHLGDPINHKSKYLR